MKILGDYHTHTIYSHGKNTILENAKQGELLGLEEIAITDHGFGHLLYGVKRKSITEMTEKVLEAEKITGLKIYLGVEANLTSADGDIDLTAGDIEKLDIILLGHHRFVKSKFKDKFRFFLPNMLFKQKVSKKIRERNTNAFIKAMDKYPIDILTHLNYDMPVNIKEVAKKAVETHTYIEINEHKMFFSQQDIDDMVKLGVQFIIDSDAHIATNVGNLTNSLEVIKKYNIPLKQVANIDKVPKFKRV